MATSPQISFDPAEHIYSVGGIVRPSVTQILEDVGIIDYDAIPDGIRTKALERGRHVHTLTQFHDEGVLDPSSIDIRLSGYLDAWRRFCDEMKFEPSLIEHRGFCELWGYAGTLDRLGVLRQLAGAKGDTIVDVKTNVAPYWTAFQTAAYANFFPSPAKYRRMAVELHRDGTYKIHEYRCADFRSDLNQFLAALSVYNCKRAR